MKREVWIAASFLGTLVFACAPAKPAIDREAELQSLRAAAEAYNDAAGARDVEKLVSYYTADARTLPPNAAEEVGPEGFRKVANAIVSLPGFQGQFGDVTAEISAGGDMGYTLGDVEFTFQGPSGETVQEKFRDFHVWKKDAAGSWKIAVDIWNSTQPLAVSQ